MAAEPSAVPKLRTVLVVDDSPVIRSVVGIYLSPTFKVVEAEGADRALAVIKLVPVDLIVVDQNMPGTSGLAFVNKIRSDPNATTSKIPIIVITGDVRSSDLKARCLAAGVNAFLPKPVSGAGLVSTVQNLLR